MCCLERLEDGTIAAAVKDDGACEAAASWLVLKDFLLLVLSLWDLAGDNLDKAFAAGNVASAGALGAHAAVLAQNLEKVGVIGELDNLLGAVGGNAGDGAKAEESLLNESHYKM